MIVKVKPLYALKRLTINTGVLGVSGYTGQELVRLLNSHTEFKLSALFSTSLEGPYSKILPEFAAYELPDVVSFDVNQCHDLDVIFLAVPHTKAMPIVAQLMVDCPKLKIVDLSADFRLRNVDSYEATYDVPHTATDAMAHAVYGLPEKYKDQLLTARLCANPGCYATSIILGLLPLINHLDPHQPITIDAKSGVSGAGKSLKTSSLFCEVHNNLSAYATGVHRHQYELIQESGFQNVLFSPHLIPMHRGIESAIYIHHSSMDEEKLHSIYSHYYQDAPFTTIYPSETMPSTRLVNYTNQCAIIPKKRGEWLVVFSLLDNLIKGASGQAIQNANIMFGLDETTGLT